MLHRLSVAPMMDWTDRHDRYFLRQISQHTLLYTEMVTTGAILHGDRRYLLEYHPTEHPLVLQLGGNHAPDLAECARIAQDYGYREVNLNVGCPSDRVQSGRFGACLMAEPDTVARGVEAMRQACQLPVTVKHRIGIDDQDSYPELQHFVRTIAAAGCDTFIVHARKAWLNGLSPKENRTIPPLRYDVVYQLKQDFPELTIVINGGITQLDQVEAHLQQVDGVMIGREAYQNPYILAEVDRRIYGDNQPIPSRHDIVRRMYPYIAEYLAQGGYLSRVTRHMLGLFAGQVGARAWKRTLSERACKAGAGLEVLQDALACVPELVKTEE